MKDDNEFSSCLRSQRYGEISIATLIKNGMLHSSSLTKPRFLANVLCWFLLKIVAKIFQILVIVLV